MGRGFVLGGGGYYSKVESPSIQHVTLLVMCIGVKRVCCNLLKGTNQAAGLLGFPLVYYLLRRGVPYHPCAAVFSKGFEGQNV